MKEIKPIKFTNVEFGDIRIVDIANKCWFVGADIATALGYANSRKALADHVDEDDKGVTKCDTLGGTQLMTIINESGVISLVLSSKLSSAKKFKHWITHDVIPSVMKDGAYMTDEFIQKTLEDPDYIITILTRIKQEREARKIAEEEVRQKQLLLEAQKSKVVLADAIVGSKNAILIRDLAKLITSNGVPIGQNRLFGWLREHKYINDYNEPYQTYVERGLFIRIERVVDHNGGMVTHFTTKVTGKGQEYFINKFMG